MNDYQFTLNSLGLFLDHLSNKRPIVGCEVVSAYDLDRVETDFEELCKSKSIKCTNVDCRAIVSHSSFVKQMRSIPEYSAVILSHVTEIPLSSEQTNIAWSINSIKNPMFFDKFSSEHVLCLLTYLPDDLVESPCYGALKPMPGCLSRFDKEWNILTNS